jgi:tetratricopeptide (TPR) repeat protein
LYEESLKIFRQRLGNEHAEVAGLLNNLAVLKGQKGDLDRAAALYREVIALHRKSSGYLAQYGLATSLQNLGSIHKTKGEYAEARARVLELYEAWGRADQAAQYRARLTLKP